MLVTKPSYYPAFSCLAGACPDSCCQDWQVQVDARHAALYSQLPGPLGEQLRSVLRQEDEDIYMTIQDGRCPMWRRDGLCSIQAQLGEQALCDTCREFPRLTHDYGDFVELGLELSCPEAARLILNTPEAPLLTQDVPGGSAPDYDPQDMALLKESRTQALSLLQDGQSHPGQALAQLLLYGCQVQSALDGGQLEPFSSQDALETAQTMAQPGSLDAIIGLFAQLLLYGCQVQSALDGGQLEPFSSQDALETAQTMAQPGSLDAIIGLFQELEILTPRWSERLAHPAPGPWDKRTLALARYFVQRYWLQAVSDYLSTAQLFSKEIENDADNLDTLLDAAYTHPACTDDKLLGLLLG